MTTKSTGAIYYYPADGGALSRTVTGEDVAAMEAELDALRKYLEELTPGGSEFSRSPEICFQWVQQRLSVTGKLAAKRNQLREENDALKQAYRVASAIMRSQPVGVPPRLVNKWRAAQQQVEAVEKVTK